MTKKIISFIQENRVFLMILGVFLLIRFIVFNNFYRYESNATIRQTIELITIKGQIFNALPHFPLTVILYKIWWLISNHTIIGVKSIHLLLNIITFFIIYKTSLLLYKEKRIANRAITIYTISFYAYAWISMGIDQDLFVNPLFFILTLYLYKKSPTLSFWNIIKIAISWSLLTISRPILGLIVFFIIFLDMFGNTIKQYWKHIKIKNIVNYIWNYLKIFLPYLIIGGILCYLMYYLFPDPVTKSINNYMKMFSWTSEWTALLTKLSFWWQLFIYTTPLILAIFLLVKDFWKHQLIIIASFTMFLYVYMWLKWWDPARRLMPVLPVLMIGIWFICNKYINKKHIIQIIGVGTIMLVINSMINYKNLPLDITDYLLNPLNKIFILTSTVFNPIYLDSKLVFFIAWFSLLSFLSILLFRKKIFIRILLIFGLWINIFLIFTDMFQIWQPNIQKISKNIYNFCYENCKIWENIYFDWISKDSVLLGIENREIWQYFSFKTNEEKKEKVNKILKNAIHIKNINLFTNYMYQEENFRNQIQKNWSGYVFLTYYYGKKNDKVTEILNKNCNLQRTFTKNNYVKWLIYYCDIK